MSRRPLIAFVLALSLAVAAAGGASGWAHAGSSTRAAQDAPSLGAGAGVVAAHLAADGQRRVSELGSTARTGHSVVALPAALVAVVATVLAWALGVLIVGRRRSLDLAAAPGRAPPFRLALD